VFVVALATWALFGMLVSDALGNHVTCGDVITTDTTLDSDLLDCPGHGIVIGAPGITLDLNGHTVDGDGDPRPRLGCDTGIVNGRFDNCGGAPPGHDGVTIRNGTVREFAHGVQVVDADRNTLLRLVLEDNTGFGGIATYLMSHGRIQGNRAFDNNSAGIAVYEPAGTTTITGNLMGRNAGYGLELAGGVAGDRLERNVAFGNGAGFFLFGTREALIGGNRSFGNRGAGFHLADGASGNQIEGNRAWGNGLSGIAMDEGVHRNRVERNAVLRNAHAAQPGSVSGGITVDEGDDNRVTGNRVVENGGGGGIVITSESRGTAIASNYVYGNTGHGIWVGILYEDAGGLDISQNHSTANGVDGIHVSQEMLDPETHIAVSELQGNRTDRNGDDGIDVESDKVMLGENRARWNTDLGIEAVAGVLDGGGNRALGNGNPLQCLTVLCPLGRHRSVGK
jgi:parallel beta-helix repeat protein